MSGQPPEKWTGWFVTDFLGLEGIKDITDFKTGLVSVPMKVIDGVTGHEEDSALIAGIAGYKIDTTGKVPSVEAHHGWVMLLEADSKFRHEMEAWERKINQGG